MIDTDPIVKRFDPSGPNYRTSTESEGRKKDRKHVFSPTKPFRHWNLNLSGFWRSIEKWSEYGKVLNA